MLYTVITNNMTMSLANFDFPAELVTLLTGCDETQEVKHFATTLRSNFMQLKYKIHVQY